MEKKKGEIIQFNHLRLNRFKEKDCKCLPPRFEIDVNNHRVQCIECGAILDPFEALVRQAIHAEDKNRIQRERYEQAKHFQEEARYFEKRCEELKAELDELKTKK